MNNLSVTVLIAHCLHNFQKTCFTEGNKSKIQLDKEGSIAMETIKSN